MSLRRAALTRRTQLQRGGPLRRTPFTRKFKYATGVAKAARRPRDTGPSQLQRAQVAIRAAHRCERCGTPIRDGLARSIHHRLPRGRGGRNTLSNLVLLCGTGVTGCHGQVESQRAAAYDTGWLVETGIDPATKPVLVINRGHVLLTEDGDYLEVAA